MRRGAHVIALAATTFAVAAPARAADGPRLRAELVVPEGGAWVGQRVTIVVEIATPGTFAGATAFDLPRPSGAILFPPDSSPVVSSETVDDTELFVRRHELSIVAQHAGTISIEPFAVRFRSRVGSAEPTDHRMRTEPLTLEVKRPPGTEGLSTLISARALDASEEWTPEPGPATVGDAFTRTVTFRAPDVPALALPQLPASPLEGFGVYREDTQVRDTSDRGRRSGERRDTIVYVCERPGTFTIPAARLTWWNLDAERLETVEFPARTIIVEDDPSRPVAPAAGPLEDAGGDGGREALRTGLAALFVTLLLALVARRPRVRAALRERRRRLAAAWSPRHLAPLDPPDAP